MTPLLTLFTMPKPFEGHIADIQKNALLSWMRLEPSCEIVVVGDEPGVEDICADLGLRRLPEVARNEYGTPLVDEIFFGAERIARGELLGYVNTDILLISDFMTAVRRLARLRHRYLVVGRRWDLDQLGVLDFDGDWQARLLDRVSREGELHAFTGLDYFVFQRGLWPQIPPFAVGRTIWDEWLVDRARRSRAWLIDGTAAITAVHQNHQYGSPEGKHGIWYGPEARRNLELGDGRRDYLTLLDASHRLTPRGLRRNVLRPPFRRRIEVGKTVHPEMAWLLTPLLWLLDRSYEIRRRLGLAHIKESRGPTPEDRGSQL